MAQCSGWGIRCHEKEGECCQHLKRDIEKEDEYGYCMSYASTFLCLVILKEERD
jgi:hypothetical protein